MPDTREKASPKSSLGDSVKKWRGNKKVRLGVIVALLAIVTLLFVFWAKARIALAVVFFLLLAALGLETTNHDWDLGKLWETKSFEQSAVQRDSSGNILYDQEGNITTDATKGKTADAYNCDDFATQSSAQSFFVKVGGVGKDVNRLDGNKDGVACQSLPQGK